MPDALDLQAVPALGSLRSPRAEGIVTLAEFTPKLRPLRFMALTHIQ